MAFPWISEVNFEDGTKGTFDTETDSTGILDFPHYSELARTPGLAMPYSGAYCMRVAPNAGTTVAKIVETGDWDMAASANRFWSFRLWLSEDLVMAHNNVFDIFVLESAADVNEVTVSIQFSDTTGLRIGVGETTGQTQLTSIAKGVWHTVELDVTLDDGGSNDGTVTMYLDGTALTQVTGLDQAAVIQGYIGADNLDAGTTGGTILFDNVICDDARIAPIQRRFNDTFTMTKSGHAVIGPCTIDNITLISGTTGSPGDSILRVFDTDSAQISGQESHVLELRNTAVSEVLDSANMPLRLTYGCYIDLQPTTVGTTQPKAQIALRSAVGYGSEGAIRTLGLKRNWVR